MLPVVAIGALAAAFVWAPSHNILVNGPLKPVWTVAGKGLDIAFVPIHWAAQNQLIADKNREIRRLNAALDEQRIALASKDQRVKSVEEQMKQVVAAQANPTASPAAAPGGAQQSGSGAGLAQAGLSSSAGPSSADIARTAAYWNNMDPEKAATVVRRLPPEYVAKVFSKMPSDQVSEILNALPPADAAKFSQISLSR